MVLEKVFGSDKSGSCETPDEDPRDSEDGCSGHHYGEWQETSDGILVGFKRDTYRLDKKQVWRYEDDEGVSIGGAPYNAITVDFVYILQRKESRTCQHDGCRETDTSWKDVGILTEGTEIEDISTLETDISGYVGEHFE